MESKLFLSFLLSLGLALLAYPVVIPMLVKLKIGQTVHELGPKTHFVKGGTPVMGGIVFTITAVVSSLVIQPKAFLDPTFLLVVVCFVGNGLIGFIDDFIIVVKHKHEGLSPKAKYGLQSLLAIVVYFWLTKVATNTILIPVSWKTVTVPTIIFFLLVFFVVTGTTNGVNLADGLDGLCAGLSIFASIPFILFAHKAGLDNVAILLAGLIGGLVGYLKFNWHPAKIFMGDSGSLGIGGLLAGVALVTGQELMLAIVGGVYVIEVLSDIIQIGSKKIRHKKVFKMAPLHHHFELCGMKETKVVLMFWSWGAILCVIGLIMGGLM